MGKAHPHIPEDPPGSGMALPGQLLHLPQLLSRGQGRICGNSGGSGQPDHGVLRKVLPPYAGITGPRVSGGRLCQIHRRKGQLIEPAARSQGTKDIRKAQRILMEVEVVRTKITLACTECKNRNYNMTKDKKAHPDRMETKKYCRFCKTHTLHKETK